jgi:hypothetical protein
MLHKLIDIIPQFPEHEIYLWSNYGFNDTPDIDLKFVGDVNFLIGQQALALSRSFTKSNNIKLDITMYENTKIFEHIPRFNRCTDDIYYFNEEIIRYKFWPQIDNEYHGREVEQIDDCVYKVKQIFARKDGKYKNRNWTYPMLLSNYEKFVNFSHT